VRDPPPDLSLRLALLTVVLVALVEALYCGQGYSLSDEGLAPVAYPMMPALSVDYPLPRKDQKAAKGLRLYQTFVV